MQQTSKIKVCFVTTIANALDVFVLEFAKHLFETGRFDVTLISSNDDDFSKKLPSDIKFIPVNMSRGVNFEMFRVIKTLKKLFIENKYDIVQYSTPNASFYASYASYLAKVPVRLYAQWGLVYTSFKGFKRFVFKAIEKKVCQLSTIVEPDSLSNLKFGIDEKLFRPEKAHVVWNGSACGVSLDRFDISKKELNRRIVLDKYQIPPDSFVYGFVGRITGDKGVNELLSAFELISKKHSNCYLLLVGKEEKKYSLNTELIANAKMNNKIKFVGYVHEVETIMCAFDLFVLPSYREGFGLVLIESAALGIPSISSKIPGPIDAVIDNETGILIEPKNVNKLFDAMDFLYEKNDVLSSLGANAYAYAKNSFEQSKMFEMLLKDRIGLFESARKAK